MDLFVDKVSGSGIFPDPDPSDPEPTGLVLTLFLSTSLTSVNHCIFVCVCLSFDISVSSLLSPSVYHSIIYIVSVCACLSINLSASLLLCRLCLFVYLYFTCLISLLSTSVSVCLSFYLSLFYCVCLCLYVFLSFYLFLSYCVRYCLNVGLSFILSFSSRLSPSVAVCLSVYLYLLYGVLLRLSFYHCNVCVCVCLSGKWLAKGKLSLLSAENCLILEFAIYWSICLSFFLYNHQTIHLSSYPAPTKLDILDNIHRSQLSSNFTYNRVYQKSETDLDKLAGGFGFLQDFFTGTPCKSFGTLGGGSSGF